IDLAAAADSQAVVGHVFGDGRARGDISVVPDVHRGHENRIAADENAFADGRGMFLEAIVIAGNRAGADVALGAHLGVSEIGEVRHFRAFADDRLFGLHEVADAPAALHVRSRAQARERTDGHAIFQPALHHKTSRESAATSASTVSPLPLIAAMASVKYTSRCLLLGFTSARAGHSFSSVKQ